MIKALAIVPYEGLSEIMKDVAHEVEDIQIDIEIGNLYEGVAIAKEAEKSGYHVIISRGGTASLIQEAVTIPVIDIQVSGYDVLRILTLVKGFSRKAAIVGFSNITQGAATICKLLDFNIKTLTISKEAEVNETLTSLKKNDYEVVIGDVVTVQVARELGLTGVLITSGREAIIDALEETRRSYRTFSQLQQDVSLLRLVLDTNEQAIGVFNNEEKIIYGNEPFNRDFHWVKLENSSNLENLIKETAITRKRISKMIHINDSFWKMTACPSGEYIVMFIEKSLSNDANPQGEEVQSTIEIHTAGATFTPISGKSDQIQHVVKQVEQYSRQAESVWILGEQGVGKSIAAQTMYLARRPNSESFIIVNCESLRTEQLNEFNEDFFQTLSEGTIFLRNIDRLNSYMQKELYQVLKKGNNHKLKWIVSSGDDIEEKVKRGDFHHDSYHALAQLKIHIPPIRERRRDIEDLVHVFISELHPKYGNGVVGIRQDALEKIINYNWTGNVSQLKHVIEQLFLEANSYYIEIKEVETMLNFIDQNAEKEDLFTKIDISGTLEEIERQVIMKVLEEEGLNQSKAAKRLGVNRSTLWRKLK